MIVLILNSGEAAANSIHPFYSAMWTVIPTWGALGVKINQRFANGLKGETKIAYHQDTNVMFHAFKHMD
jgi:hypothetical protein